MVRTSHYSTYAVGEAVAVIAESGAVLLPGEPSDVRALSVWESLIEHGIDGALDVLFSLGLSSAPDFAICRIDANGLARVLTRGAGNARIFGPGGPQSPSSARLVADHEYHDVTEVVLSLGREAVPCVPVVAGIVAATAIIVRPPASGVGTVSADGAKRAPRPLEIEIEIEDRSFNRDLAEVVPEPELDFSQVVPEPGLVLSEVVPEPELVLPEVVPEPELVLPEVVPEPELVLPEVVREPEPVLPEEVPDESSDLIVIPHWSIPHWSPTEVVAPSDDVFVPHESAPFPPPPGWAALQGPDPDGDLELTIARADLTFPPSPMPEEMAAGRVGWLRFDDGRVVPLVGDIVLGRAPRAIADRGVGAEPITVSDPNNEVSSQHALVEVTQDGRALVTDLGSTNGTEIIDHHGSTVSLRANTPHPILPGATIVLAEVLQIAFEADS